MDSQALLDRANLLLEQKRYRDAETCSRQVLEKEPENHHALSILGRCYLNSNKNEEGMEAIRQAIAIEPGESFYFYLLAFGFYRKNSWTEAASHLETAIRLNPYVAEYFGMLAFVLIDDHMFERALQKADEGLALEADNLTCLNARSTALNKLRRTGDAIETMNEALARDPDNEITHSTVGWNLLERGKHKEARVHFMEALRIDPDYASARAGLKESLKSRLLLYKWLLQYSFWVSSKGRNFQVALPIVLYITFRVLIKLSEANSAAGLTWLLVGIYLFIVVISWTIGSIANFVLLFHRLGRHALSNTEKWAALTSVTALFLGIIIMLVSGLATGTAYEDGAFIAGLVCLSLALPLGHIDYPIVLKGAPWVKIFGVGLAALGIIAALLFAVAPGAAVPAFVVYSIAFLVYNWAGIVR